MRPTITLSRGYGQPKFAIGQRTRLGKIIGIQQTISDDILNACRCGQLLEYTVLTNNREHSLIKVFESDIQSLTPEEIQAQILAEIDAHMMQLAILQEELGENLDIRTPFGIIPAPSSQTVSSSKGISRLSTPKKNLAA